MTKIDKIIKDLTYKATISFSEFSDYVDSLQKRGDFELLNNAISKKFNKDFYNYKNITISDYKKIIYAGFKSNSTLP